LIVAGTSAAKPLHAAMPGDEMLTDIVTQRSAAFDRTGTLVFLGVKSCAPSSKPAADLNARGIWIAASTA